MKVRDVALSVAEPMPMTASRMALVGARAADFLELTKPRIAVLVLVTVAIGGFVAAPLAPDYGVLASAIVGTALVAGGASVFNQLVERTIDAKMHRTQDRPLPAGRVRPGEAFTLATLMSVSGIVYLAMTTNLLATSLAALSLVLYAGVYTPMKRYTPLNTAVGAVPGALPPVIGWAAIDGRLSVGALILFMIVYLWQFPHFFAIAWLYREDYARGGLKMLPTSKRGRRTTGIQVVAYSLALLPVSLAPTIWSLASPVYFWAALLCGLQFLGYALWFAYRRTDRNARLLLWASLIYLPSVLGFWMLDKIWFPLY